MLLNTLRCTEQPPERRVGWSRMVTGPLLRNLGCRWKVKCLSRPGPESPTAVASVYSLGHAGPALIPHGRDFTRMWLLGGRDTDAYPGGSLTQL